MSTVEAMAPERSETPLPVLSFDSEEFRPRDKLEAMNAFSRGLYEYTPEGEVRGPDTLSPNAPCLRLKAWSLGTIAAADFECAHATASTTGHRDSCFSDQLFLRVFETGRVEAQSDAAQNLLRPGMIHLMHAQNAVTPIDVGRTMSLRFSYESVGYDPARHARLLSFSTGAGLGRIVGSAVCSLFEMLPTMTVDEAREVDATLASLVRGMLSSGRVDEEAHAAVSSARGDAMRRYIRQHLQDPDLGTRSICAAFGASRATVYRIFEPHGGVVSHIRSERLTAIYRELLSAEPQYGIIRRIAEKYGFWDQGTFVRAFRRHHGTRPSDIVGQLWNTETKPEPVRPKLNIGGPTLASFWSANAVGAASPVR